MKQLLFTLIILPTLAFSQQLDMDLMKNLSPRNIGPAGMAGRVTSIDVVTDNPSIMYVGTASGGLWKSTSGGIKWDPVFEKESTASIGAVAIQQSNPSVIWVGTGEGNPRNSLNGGYGVYRSLDGGKNWQKMGLSKTRHIHKIIIHPHDPNTVFVGAIGSPWGIHPERGVFKTTNGGKTWNKILFVNNKTGVADLVMDPQNPNKLIAGMWEHKRDPWFFNSGGEGSGLYITYDGGETWEKRTKKEGLPDGPLGRIGLAIAPSMPNRVYALIESKKNALYRSDDGGFTWENINSKSDIGNRPFYYSDLYVDPQNENRVYSVFTYVNVSEDGGKNFTQLMPAYGVSNGVHPDHHAWWIHPEDGSFMMDGNDGGVNISRDRGKSWNFIQTIPVAQFYHIAVDNELPYNVYGGMQDNGSWAGPAYVWKAQGIRNSYWQEISFGDGFDVLPDPENSRYGVSASQQGYASIYDRETGYNEIIRPTYPDEEIELRFNWNAAMNRDPRNPSTLYFGSQFVHKSVDGGQNWSIISPDLTTNDPEKQKQGDSGGLTMDATGAENYCTILVIEPDPTEEDVLWVGTDDGKVHVSKNGGDSWDDVTLGLTGMPSGAWITQIKPSNKNNGEALLVANDYRRFNYEPYGFKTTDYGQTWQRIVDGSDALSYALSIVEDPIEENLLFLGTDDGLYISIDKASSWTKWTAGFPTTNVMDLIIHPRENDLVIGTFGRAAWVLDDIRPLRELASKGSSEISKVLNVYPAPTGYITSNQQATGSRFGGDAMFNAENKSRNALITYSISRPQDEKEETPKNTKKKKAKSEEVVKEDNTAKPKLDSLLITVSNENGEIIRTIKRKAPKENGFHRFEWGMEEKGVGRMRRTPRASKSEPGGIDVLPGTYWVKITFGEQSDSTAVEVKYDPRLNITSSAIEARYNALKDLEKLNAKGVQATKQLAESIKTVNSFKSAMEKKDKDGFKEQLELVKNTKDTLVAIQDIFFGKEDERQGITKGEVFTVSSDFGRAWRYTSNATHAPGDTEFKLTQKFENSLKEALDVVNSYYSTEWLNFKKSMEALDLSTMKEYSDIE